MPHNARFLYQQPKIEINNYLIVNWFSLPLQTVEKHLVSHLETPGVFNYGGEEHPRLNIVVRADHKSSFLSWPGYQLDYTGYTGSGTELYIFATTPPSKLYY